MLTASHNPPQYNGIKVFRSDTLSYADEEQDAVENNVTKGAFALADWRSIGKTTPVDVKPNLHANGVESCPPSKKTGELSLTQDAAPPSTLPLHFSKP